MPTRTNIFTFSRIFLKAVLGSLSVFLVFPFCLQGQPCVPPPSGLVSWWQAESNGLDSADSNHGTLIGNTAYAAGRVGRAFSFDGDGDAVRISNLASLQLQDFTIEAWIKRGSTTQASLDADGGVILGYGGGGYNLAFSDDGHPFLGKVGVSFVSSTSQITDTNFHHVTVTKAGGTVVFYVDGVGYPAPDYNPGFTFGSQVAIGAQGETLRNSFLGLIDELDIFNRALTSSEILAIYNASSAGKCKTSPTCATPPSGLVSWWRAEVNALDTGGTNNGTLAGNTGFSTGRVGHGFEFDGNGDAVQVGNPSNLQLQNFTIEAWIRRANTSVVTFSGDSAAFFGYGFGGYAFGLYNDGRLFLTKVGVDNVILAPGITNTDFHHVAVTKSGSTVFFYIDGTAYAVPVYVTSYDFSSPAAVGARGIICRAAFWLDR